MVIAAVRRLLHADGDVRDPGSLQLGPEHGQCIGVLAVGDVVGTANGLLGGLQLGLGLRLLRRLALRPDGIEVVCLAVLAAVVPIVTLLEGAVDGGAVGILDGAAVAALRPTGEGIALPTVAAGSQLHILTEGCRLVGHGAGGGVLVAVLDVILDDVLIVTPLGDESHLVAAEHGVLGDGLTEGAVGILDVPAVQRLVGGVVAGAKADSHREQHRSQQQTCRRRCPPQPPLHAPQGTGQTVVISEHRRGRWVLRREQPELPGVPDVGPPGLLIQRPGLRR